jgi:PBP4 family serine-type D-alanyl-D-alanine carboxypeptidase
MAKEGIRHFAVLGCAVFSAAARGAPTLEQQLAATLVKLPHASAKVGACVIDLREQRVLFARNADFHVTPASTMKLFAMSAALAELGPNFTFDTILATDGTNLIVIGDGDPGFADEKLHKARGESIYAPFVRWAEKLKHRGEAHFAGDLIIDESVFDNQRLHPSWERADLDSWYAAPVSGLNINDNCLDITVSPSKKNGSPAIVSVQPRNALAKIANQCLSGGKGEPVLHHVFDSFDYVVSGRCPKTISLGSFSFPDPGLLFANSFRVTLQQQGITVRGVIRRAQVRRADGAVPSNLTVIDHHRTPLGEVLARAGKDSQNLFAECLLKRAGYAWAHRHGKANPQGTWEHGAHAVHELLGYAKIDMEGLYMADGSGLSRQNSCTARQLTSLLAWANTLPLGRVLHESLATAGVDGSLRKRLKNSDGRIHAKTGTMRGIRALAGYVDSDAGPRYAFAIVFNGYPGGSAPYKAIQDRFCRVLADACETRVTSR